MNRFLSTASLTLSVAVLVAACTGNGSSGPSGEVGQPQPGSSPNFQLAQGFAATTTAQVPNPRELAALPNGDLLVATDGSQIYIVPGAENSGSAGQPVVFISLPDSPAQGIALSASGSAIYVATQYGVYQIPYHSGDQSEPNASAVKIASVRSGPVAPHSDGDVHHTSSIAVTPTTLYVSVGSSCNACAEVDPTRATIQAMNLDGSGMHTVATRIRNAIAVTVNPASGVLWAGGAGQDDLPYGHPYEFADALTLQAGSPVDYGWPDCEENRIAYVSGSNCSSVAVPRVEFPAYATHIGMVFYPTSPTGSYAFPAALRGALFVTSHGSWHCCPSTVPEVAYVAMNGDTPKTTVDWNNPSAQWTPFVWGFGSNTNNAWTGRPTGIAVGTQGSLFVGDDKNGVIYRIRPNANAQ